MRNEREYWERKVKILEKSEREFLRRKVERLEKQEEENRKQEKKENPGKRQEVEIERGGKTMVIVAIILYILVFFFIWGLVQDVAIAAFVWLLFFAVFGWTKA